MAIATDHKKELEDLQYYREQLAERKARMEALLQEQREMEAEADRYNKLLEALHQVVSPETALWTPRILDAEPSHAAQNGNGSAVAPAPKPAPAVAAEAPAMPAASPQPTPMKKVKWAGKFDGQSQPTCLAIMAAEVGGELDIDEATQVLIQTKKLGMRGKPARTRVAWLLANDSAWNPTKWKTSPFAPVADALGADGKPQRYRLVKPV